MNIIRRAVLAAVLMAGITPVFAQAPAPVPALPDSERRTSYSITASTCACAINFQYYQDSTDYQNAVEIFLNGVKVAYNDTAFGWTITVPTGSLATRARPISDAVLTFNSVQTGTVQIVGAQRPRRLTEVSESRGVAARDFNQFANTITAELREVWDRFLRTPRVPAGETLALLPPLASRANMGVCFDTNGNFAPCVGIPSSAFTAGSGVTFTGTNPSTISVATYSAGTGISFSGSNPTVISVGASSNGALYVPTRAAAVALDLHTYGVVQSGGYASPGDGGGATFRNIGSAAFIDSFVTTYSFSGGSGYTNGSYFGVIFSASGRSGFVIGTATVSGGAVAAVNIKNTPGNQCTVGDIYTTSTITGGSFSITVTGCSAPLASFTDSVGTNFQFVPSTWPNILQFGAKGDWNGTDGTATDNFNSIQAASWFAAFKSSTSFDSGGYWGGKVVFPSGSYMAGCSGTSSLIVGQSVVFEGPSEVGAQIKLCNSFSTTTPFIEVCDPNWHFACFGSKLKNISVFADRTVGVSSGTYMIHSNNVQDFGGLDHVYIYAGQRGCTDFEHGYGGASTVSIQYVSCNGASTNTIMMLFGNTVASGLAYGSTIFEITDLVLGGPSSCSPTCQTQPGVVFRGGGFYDVNGVHCENAGQFCITVDIPVTGNNDMVRLHNINAGWGAPGVACLGTIFLAGTNTQGNTIIGMVPPGSCSAVVSNGQSGGTNRTAAIGMDMVFNP
jgi:hypothetical protein